MLTSKHRLSFGCSGLAGMYKPVSTSEAYHVLDKAWENGIRYFDTAPHYGNGMSEHRLGSFLRDKEGWLLSTKVGRVLSPTRNPAAVVNGFHNSLPFDQRFDYTYDGIMRSVEGSFNRLGLNRIDILYVHDIGEPQVGTDTIEHRSNLLDSGTRALEQLKRQGIVGAVGLGVNTVEICEDLVGRMDMDLILLAGRYTLLEQSARGRLFPMCLKHNIRLVIGGVFNSGVLATGPVEGAHYNYAPAPQSIMDRVAAIQAICARNDVPLAAASLQYPDRNPLVASTLIGTSNAGSLIRNIEQFNMPLPGGLWDELRAEGVIGADE